MTEPEPMYQTVYADGRLFIPHNVIRDPGGTTAELAVLLYIMSRTDPSVHPDDQVVELWDILLRFPEDDPVMLATTIKRLAKKGLLESIPEIEVNLVEIIEQKHNIKVS